MLNNKNYFNNFNNIINVLIEEKKQLVKSRIINQLLEAAATPVEETEDVEDTIKASIKQLNKNKDEILKLNSRKFNALLKEIRKADNEFINKEELDQISNSIHEKLLKDKDVNSLIDNLVESSLQKTQFKNLNFHIINEISGGDNIKRSKSYSFKKNIADFDIPKWTVKYTQDHLPKLYQDCRAFISEADFKNILRFMIDNILKKYLDIFIDFDLDEKQNSVKKVTKYFRVKSSEIMIESGKDSNFRRICNNLIINKTQLYPGQKNIFPIFAPFYDENQIEGKTAKLIVLKTGSVTKGDEIFRLELEYKDKLEVSPKAGGLSMHYGVSNGIATTRFYAPINGTFNLENNIRDGVLVNLGSLIGSIEEQGEIKKADFLTSDLKVKPDYSITHFFLNEDDYKSNQNLKNILFAPIEILNFTDDRSIKVKTVYKHDDIKGSKFDIEEFDNDQNFITPFDIFVLIAFRLVNKYSSFTYEMLKASVLETYNQQLNKIHTYFTTFDSKKIEADQKSDKIIFKTGESAKKVVDFVSGLNIGSGESSTSVGTFKNDVMKLFFDTSLETNNLKTFANEILSSEASASGSEIKGAGKKLSARQIRNIEEVCLKFFNKSGYGIGNGEYFIIALLMGVDIPATLGLTLEKGRETFDVAEISKKMNNIIDKISIYHGGPEQSFDIDFKSHFLPANCPTRGILSGKTFEVKEIEKSSSSIRVGSEGIRSLSSHISKFYIKTNEVKKFLFNFKKEQGEIAKERKLFALINHCIDHDDFYGIPIDTTNIKDIFKRFYKFMGESNQEDAKRKIKSFMADFYSTNIDEFISEEISESNVSQVYNFDAGNFSLDRLRLIYLSHLCIIEALKIIINLLSSANNNIELAFGNNKFSLPVQNVDLYSSDQKIITFDLKIKDVLNIINDKKAVKKDVKNITNENFFSDKISHAGDVLLHAVELYNNLKNLNLESAFKSITLDQAESSLEFVENFGDAQSTFKKIDGVFIVKGSLEESTSKHSDLRILFVPKQKIQSSFRLNGASQHRPNFSLTDQSSDLARMTTKGFFEINKAIGKENI
jgi:hypothetical protein